MAFFFNLASLKARFPATFVEVTIENILGDRFPRGRF
jgi:hypothetical protein